MRYFHIFKETEWFFKKNEGFFLNKNNWKELETVWKGGSYSAGWIVWMAMLEQIHGIYAVIKQWLTCNLPLESNKVI